MSSPNAPAWLIARPIAHRGLHDAASGRMENTRAAFLAAVAHDFAIECDVRLSRDGVPVVFHDGVLERMTTAAGPVADRTAGELAAIPFRSGADGIEPLANILAAVAGRVAWVIEIKSEFDGDLRLTHATLDVVRKAGGRIALKSFDPNVVAALRMLAPEIPRGIIAEARYDYAEWVKLTPDVRGQLATLAHLPETQPDFISYSVKDLPEKAEFVRAAAPGLPLMTWTVRSPEQRATAASLADQMVFEGFMP